jgi:hypothetical protein
MHASTSASVGLVICSAVWHCVCQHTDVHDLMMQGGVASIDSSVSLLACVVAIPTLQVRSCLCCLSSLQYAVVLPLR